ncbi:MAG: hypothetical protein ACLQGP_08545 [Isosphaeraceae bacterium]
MSFDLRKLTIAAFGLILLQMGWSTLDMMFPGSPGVAVDLSLSSRPVEGWNGIGDSISGRSFRLSEPLRVLTDPLSVLFDPASDWAATLHAFLGLVWLVAVWGVCGGAIARLAVIQEARMRQPGIGEGFRFALGSAPALILAPLCPLFAIAFSSLVGVVFGLLYRIPYGSAIVGAGLIIPLAAGLIMTLLAAGLVAGWPLMHAALAAGADDALDALSRTFGYLNQRFGLYVVGVAMAWLGGLVGLIVVDLLIEGLIRLTHWSLSISGGRALPEALFRPGEPAADRLGAATHGFWLGLVLLLNRGWVFSYVWTAGAFLYLWLREEVDGTPRTEIDPPVAGPTASPIPSTAVPKLEPVGEISGG